MPKTWKNMFASDLAYPAFIKFFLLVFIQQNDMIDKCLF